MNLRERCQKIYQTSCQWGYLSVRALAQATFLSKSSVYRLLQKIKGIGCQSIPDLFHAMRNILEVLV